MEEFTERMLKRIRKRQELLDSTSTSLNVAEPASSEVYKSMTPPSRRKRRECLANLASRVDLWLENDAKCSEAAESTQNDNNSTVKVTKNDVPNHYTNQKIVSKLSSDASASVEKTNETNKFKSIQTHTPKPQYQQLPKKLLLSNNEKPLQWQSPNLTSTLTVAQRRALFENNVQQQNKKPTTTTVTISLKKITPAKVENKKPVAEEVIMPPCSIPSDMLTPPSRCATQPQAGSANAITPLDDVIPQRHTWTPPCIKKVMFKKQMVDEQQQILQDYDKSDVAVVSSSPINTNIVSPADRIAMSVGHVKFMPGSSSSGLYPDLSLIEDNSNNGEESTLSPLENQFNGHKRRSIGTPTASSESVTDIVLDAEMLVAKRSRCDEPKPDDSGTFIMESSSTTPITSENHYSSMMSDHAADNQLSQICNSFTFYHGGDDPNKMPDLVHQNLQDLIVKSPANELMQSDRLHPEDNYFDDKKNERSVEQSVKNQALVHTVSTYRKQQQQLRLGGTLSSKTKSMKNEGYLHSTLHKQQLDLFQDDNDDDNDDEEDYKLQELETAAERARHLERIVVPEQERIIEQATQALNICDMYRQQRGSLKPAASSNFSAEHVHAERLLLIAGLRRTDAVREAQRLRIEQTLSPGGILGERFYDLKNNGEGKTLVIESLRVPLLSAMVSGGSNYKATKLNHNDGIENLTRWSGAYRYFVCVIRAAATAYRSPMTAATRPADVVEESVQRFSFDAGCRIDEEVGYGYVEFITKKQFKSSGRKCLMPSESEGAPIMIHGLDDGGWKITVELYGLSSLNTGDHDNHNSSGNSKDHDGHENSKSVLDKLWSTVTTPSKELKKQHTTTPATCIESPGGPMAVRNTVFRQLGYFVFSDGQVDRQQFTLNKIHQSVSSTSNSRAATHIAGEETVRVKMRILEDGEQYVYYNEGERDLHHSLLGSNKHASSGNTVVRKPLTLPTECKRMEGFLTLFDDHELRATPAIERGPQWQRHSDIGGSANLGGTTLWRRLWFRVEIIDDPKYQETSKSDDDKQKQQNNIGLYKTIVLRYWMYPEHAEQQREPMGAINLGRCLPMSSHKTKITSIVQQKKQSPTPAAPALPDLCARPNTLRLLMYNIDSANNNDNYGGDNLGLVDDTDDPLLLAADTADERREWCETINASVRAIDEHNKQMKTIEAARLKQEQRNQEKVQKEKPDAWPTTYSNKTKSFGKKNKYYK